MTQLHPSTPNPTDAADHADHAVDRLLDAHLAAASEELTPSSGFIASVMQSIHTEASEPPPIAFPWRRVLPGAVAILCGLLAFLVFAIHKTGFVPKATPPAVRLSSISWPQLTQTLAFPPHATLFWILVAACLSIAAVAASFRVAGRSD
jgi:hypothetical protein